LCKLAAAAAAVIIIAIAALFLGQMELLAVLVAERAAITILLLTSLVGQVLPVKVLPVAINRHQLLVALAAAARLLSEVLQQVRPAAMAALEKLHLYLVEHMRVVVAAAQKHTLAEQAEQAAAEMGRQALLRVLLQLQTQAVVAAALALLARAMALVGAVSFGCDTQTVMLPRQQQVLQL
jgi:hypothetical protein